MKKVTIEIQRKHFFLENYLTTIGESTNLPLQQMNTRVRSSRRESTSSKYFSLQPITTTLLNPAFRPLKGLGPPFNKKGIEAMKA